MTGRLILHLGPPKTATTSLQIALIGKADGSYDYGGAAQPTRDKSDLASRLHRLCLYGADVQEDGIEEIVAEIAGRLASGRTLVISEELFLVDGARATYRQKIANLARVVRRFDPTVILCLREPLEALRSLYQELYTGIPLKEKLSFDRFLESSQAGVFAYEDLCEHLRNEGFGQVRTIRFEDLTSGRVRFADVVGNCVAEDEFIAVNLANASSVRGEGGRRLRRLGMIRMRHLVPMRALERIGLLSRVRSSPLIRGVRVLSSLPVRGVVDAELQIPEAVAERFSSQYLRVMSSNHAPRVEA